MLCFSHDWSGDPLSKTHLMRLLAKDNRVLWVNSIGYRAPSVSGRDLKRAFQKVKAATSRTGEVERNIFVLNPLAIPAYGVPAMQKVNRQLLRLQVRAPDERSSASSCRRGVSRSRASVCRVARDHRSRSPPDRSRSRAAPRSRAISQSCAGARLRREERRRPAGGVAHGQQVEDDVVVVALERPGRRQDDVGVPGGLVDVEVDRHHHVEARQRLVEPVPRGRRRAPGCPRWSAAPAPAPRPVCSISSASADDRQLAPERRQPAHPVTGACRSRRGPSDARPTRSTAGVGEHRAARPVEVAGEHVDPSDQPTGRPRRGPGSTRPSARARRPTARRRGRARGRARHPRACR